MLNLLRSVYSARLSNARTFWKLVFPIIIRNGGPQYNRIYIDKANISIYLDLALEPMNRFLRIFAEPEKLHSIRPKADKMARALHFQHLIQSGQVNNRAELSRYLGVSRAWVTKAMRILDSEQNDPSQQ